MSKKSKFNSKMGFKIKVFNLFMYNIATEECIYVFNEQFSGFCIVVVH